MAFPTTIDSYTTHANGDVIDPAYDNGQQTSLVAIETKVGVDGSAVTTTHDYKLGEVISSDKAVGKSATQTLTNKTIAGGSNTISGITETMQSTSDITTLDVTSTKHGYAPKSPADATKFLNGATTPVFALVKDSDLTTSDITTNDVSTSKHGFVPKAPNDATKFLNGVGAYTVPAVFAFKNGTTSKNSADASTTQTIAHGLGITPKYIRLTANGGSGSGNLGRAHSVYNGTTQSSQSVYYESANVTIDTTFTLNTSGTSGTQTGVLTFDSTNITITWTKTNSPTGSYQLLWEAIG